MEIFRVGRSTHQPTGMGCRRARAAPDGPLIIGPPNTQSGIGLGPTTDATQHCAALAQARLRHGTPLGPVLLPMVSLSPLQGEQCSTAGGEDCHVDSPGYGRHVEGGVSRGPGTGRVSRPDRGQGYRLYGLDTVAATQKIAIQCAYVCTYCTGVDSQLSLSSCL